MTSKHWVFTLNNYLPADVTALRCLIDLDYVEYLVFGREVADSGTPHLQGYISFSLRKARNFVRAALGRGVHVEFRRGSSTQAAEYCKKDGDYEEFGERPVEQGHRADFDAYKAYIIEIGRRPTRREMILNFPSLFVRYNNYLMEMADAYLPLLDAPADIIWRDWQRSLIDVLNAEPNMRNVDFLVDTEGNSGKSWFARMFMLQKPDEVQILRVAKRDDMAHAIDETKKYFFVDVARAQMEHLQYSVLEMLKDGMVFSPKYNSRMKIIRHAVHVVVFCNEQPNMDILSKDRYNVVAI